MLKIGFQILVDGDKIRQEGRRMEMLMEEWRFHNSKSENDCGKEKEVAYQKGMESILGKLPGNRAPDVLEMSESMRQRGPGGVWLERPGPQISTQHSADGNPPRLPLDITLRSFLLSSSGASWWLSGEEPACQCRRLGFDPCIRKIPRRRTWQPTPVFLPGESHGQGGLADYSPWGCKESDTT